MFGKLRTVIYHVHDLSKAKAWYAELLNTQPYFDEPFYVGFHINGFELGLDPSMNGISKGNNTVAYWSVTGIASVVEQLKTAGATVLEAVHNVGGDINVATVCDPFGNAIGLIEGA